MSKVEELIRDAKITELLNKDSKDSKKPSKTVISFAVISPTPGISISSS